MLPCVCKKIKDDFEIHVLRAKEALRGAAECVIDILNSF